MTNEDQPSLKKLCCELQPSVIHSYPLMASLMADQLESMYSYNFGSNKGVWYACKSCGQRWLYWTVCVGHRDWDQHLKKCDDPAEFFTLAKSAIPL